MVEILYAILTAAAIGLGLCVVLAAIVFAWGKADSPASHVDDESVLKK